MRERDSIKSPGATMNGHGTEWQPGQCQQEVDLIGSMQAGCLPSLQQYACKPLNRHRARYAAQSVYGYVDQSAQAQPAADAPPRLKVLPRVQYRCAYGISSMLDICATKTRLMLCSETLADVDPRELSCLLEAVRRPREAWHSLPMHAQCAFIRQSGTHPGEHSATPPCSTARQHRRPSLHPKLHSCLQAGQTRSSWGRPCSTAWPLWLLLSLRTSCHHTSSSRRPARSSQPAAVVRLLCCTALTENTDHPGSCATIQSTSFDLHPHAQQKQLLHCRHCPGSSFKACMACRAGECSRVGLVLGAAAAPQAAA